MNPHPGFGGRSKPLENTSTKHVGLVYATVLLVLCVFVLWSPGEGGVQTRAMALLDKLLDPAVLTAMLAAIGGEKIAPEVKELIQRKANG